MITINDFWASLPREERDIIAEDVGVTRASVGQMITKGVFTRKLQTIILTLYPDVEFYDFGPPKLIPKPPKPKPKKPPKIVLARRAPEVIHSYTVLGTVREDLAIAQRMLDEIKKSVNGNRRLVVWISPKLELRADHTTGGAATEFMKDLDGVVGIYARHCSLMDVVNDLRKAYVRRANKAKYEMVPV